MPTANAQLQIARFSRVGLATESPPVDIALRAGLSASGGDVRAVVRRGGVIGRLQARMAPLPGGGAWTDRLMQAPLSGGVRYSGPADVLWAMTGISGQEISGPLAVAADFGGRLREPSLNGVIRADALRYENPTYGTVVRNIAVRGRFTQTRLEITSLTGRAGDGSLSASGTVGLDAASGFPMDLRATLNRAELAGSDQVAATVSGTLTVTNSRERGAVIAGDLVIPEARYQIVRQGGAEVPELTGVRRRNQPPPSAAKAPASGGLPSNWRLNIRVRAPNRLFVNGMGLDSEWRSDLRVRGTANAPVVLGELEVVRGTYTFAGRRLEITDADVQFDGATLTNPALNITASTTVQGVTAAVNVTGRAQDPQISFSSTPALPQDEILARLLFGNTVGQLSPVQAIQLGAALNSFRTGGGGANPLGKLRSATGLSRLRVVSADQAAGGGAALAAGQYITSNIYLEVVTDARGFTATQLEIALSRTLSILSQTGSFGGSNISLRYSRDY
ncbi:translocation/assembly module TamB domain-containing protein [Phenylobacterium deserti]